MNFPFYIARRYLFSRKSTHAINLISLVSVVGVAVATTALVVTLSVFNGFSDLVASLFTAIDPQIELRPTKGKTVTADDPVLAAVRAMPEVMVATETVEGQALAMYGGRQTMVTLKGVEDNFDSLTHIQEILLPESAFPFQTHAADISYGYVGIQVAQLLGLGYEYDGPLHLYAPLREGQLSDVASADEAFLTEDVYSPGCLFSVQQAKYDRTLILTDISLARRLFQCQGELSSLELRLQPGSNFDRVKQRIKDTVGDRYSERDRYEQQDDTFSIMKIEKLMAYLFLSFILMVACFNIVGSLSMLIIDKKEDVQTLRALGATDRQIVQVFLFEGRMIAAAGAVAGIAAGLLLCWLQQCFGIVALGSQQGAFVVDAYPVSVHPGDIVAVFLTVLATSFVAVWYPVHYFARRLLRGVGELGSL